MSDLNTAPGGNGRDPERTHRRKTINQHALLKILNTRTLGIIPRLKDAPEAPPAQREAWRKKHWQFHLTGTPPDLYTYSRELLPLKPAVLEHIFSQNDTFLNFPFVTSKASPDSSRARYHSLHTWLQGVFPVPSGEGKVPSVNKLIRDNFWLFIKLTRDAVGQGTRKIKIHRLFETVVPEFRTRLLEQGALPDELDAAMEKLRAGLPAEGRIFGLGEHALYHLAVTTALTKYFPRRQAFISKAQVLISQLEEKLRAHRHHSAPPSPESLRRGGLGRSANQFIDPEKLSHMLRSSTSQGLTLSPARVRRIETVLEVLHSHVQKLQRRKAYLLFSSRPLPEGMTLSQGDIITSEDCFAAAGKRFEEISLDLVAVCRALRTAQLEAEDAYLESEHEELLHSLAWFSLDEEERSYLQPILVFERVQALHGAHFNSFANLLLNRYPVTTVIAQGITGKESVVDANQLMRSQTDWGYLTMAYRVAYVLQSSLSQPSHLVSGFLAISAAVRPAVAFVAVPSWDTPVELAQVQLKAAIESRITPLYRYDPQGGLSFPERFQLSMNPQPQTQWPIHTIYCQDDGGQKQEIVSEFTFAHFAATDPAYRANFHVIERAAWADNQISIHRYLTEIDNLQPNAIPYILVVDEKGEIQRAVLTRPLAFACWQRILSWRNHQERAGIHNVFLEEARRQAQSESEEKLQQELACAEKKHADALKAQAAKTTDSTLHRLASLLLDPEATMAMPVAEAAQKTPVPAPTPPKPPPAAEPAPAADADEAAAIKVPCIESELCTSCNECINLNSMMFQYNDNKEAYIAQVEAGTYLQLVQAAEKCPSSCIHPGLPREGDKTADAELIARASKFN